MTPSTIGTSRMRLDRFVSHAANLTRSQVRKLLHADDVAVDGVITRNAATAVCSDNVVTVHGEVLDWPRLRYVMLHKPAGYVCSTEEAGQKLVGSLIVATWAHALHVAGRLDADTTGLVLLTNDGEWSHALTSPRRNCAKIYLAGTRHPLAADIAERFAAGLMLHGEDKPTLPAGLELVDSHTARVSIREGRYHQVRRMFAACGNRVETLHREAIGSIVLDAALAPGEWRELTAGEIGSIAHD